MKRGTMINTATALALLMTCGAGAETNLPDQTVCRRAINSERSGWVEGSFYTEEASRRGLTFRACDQMSNLPAKDIDVPPEEDCAGKGAAEVQRLDESDPTYFKDMAYLYSGGNVEEHKRLYILRYTSRCNFLRDCMKTPIQAQDGRITTEKRSERVCAALQPY